MLLHISATFHCPSVINWSICKKNQFPNAFLCFVFSDVKVQVKIISANYMLDDDENSALFSEEESASFQNLIVAILVSLDP